MVPHTLISKRIKVMPVAPPVEPTESENICMYGKPSAPVGLSSTDVMSTVTKRTAITMPNPAAPLSRVVRSIDQGTVMLARLTSSAIYEYGQKRDSSTQLLLT